MTHNAPLEAVISYTPIGIIHSPFKTPPGTPIQAAGARGIVGTIVLAPAYIPGLQDLEGFSHLLLIYHFHLVQDVRLTVTPFLDDHAHGIFATRAPTRPNPIGISIVHLLRMEGETLHIEDVDVVDGTPLLDIKPFVPAFDVRDNVRVGWLTNNRANLSQVRADERFLGTGSEV